MTTLEISEELGAIRTRIQRLRLRNRRSLWFGHLMKTIESFIDSALEALDHIRKASK